MATSDEVIRRRLERLGVRIVCVAINNEGNFAEVVQNGYPMCTECRFSVNPIKTEFILFTTKTKIPGFVRPMLDGIHLPLSSSDKYLGVFLDPKLNWRVSIDEGIKN